MSYHRDSGFSRGVGAIAAADSPRARMRRKTKVRVLRDRDRALSQITYGPRGGIGRMGLGRINTAGTAYQNLATPVKGSAIGPGIEGGTPGTMPTGVGVSTVQLLGRGGRGQGGGGLLIPATAAPSLLLQATAAPTSSGIPGSNIGPQKSTLNPPAPASYMCWDGSMVGDLSLCPIPPPSSSTTSTTSSGASSSGGGGGGGGGGGDGGTMVGPPAPLSPMDTPQVPDDVVATGMSTNTKLLIGAAAVGALYLFLRKKG